MPREPTAVSQGDSGVPFTKELEMLQQFQASEQPAKQDGLIDKEKPMLMHDT